MASETFQVAYYCDPGVVHGVVYGLVRASSRWSSSLYCLKRKTDQMIIRKTHPILVLQYKPEPEEHEASTSITWGRFL